MPAYRDEHGLTKRERAYCDYLHADPERNGTKAAERAGYSKKSSAYQSSILLRRPKVQTYLTHLQRHSLAAVQKRTNQSIATCAEALEIMSNVARTKVGDYLLEDGTLDFDALRAAPPGIIAGLEHEVRAIGGTEDAGESRVRKVKFGSALQAAKHLVDYYQKAEDQTRPPVSILNVFGNLPPEFIRAVQRELLTVHAEEVG